MENTTIPQWLDAAVNAAGISMIYNADDWKRIANPANASQYSAATDAANDPWAAPH